MAKLAVTTGLNHESQQTLRRRSVINMNDVVVINNHGQPPGMYELPSHRNALSPSRSSNVVDQVFRFADVTVDVGRRKITRGGEAVKVTPAEYSLLLYFLNNIDRALARDAILNAAWGYDFYPKDQNGGCARRAASA
jgi:DNA-binding response OmpR family regulator